MTNPLTRLLIAIGVVVVSFAGSYAVRAAMETPEVALPDRDFDTLPMQLGKWHGEDVELDPEVFINTDAHKAVQREYEDRQGNVISLFLAIYDQPDRGIYHNPMNCYRANGYQKTEDTMSELKCDGVPSTQIRITTWEKSGRKEIVIYWYRFGEHAPFSRWDMAFVRWKMAGITPWPAMIKVLLQTSKKSSGGSEAELVDFAKLVHQWVEEEPEVRTEAGKVSSQPVEDRTLEDPAPSQ